VRRQRRRLRREKALPKQEPERNEGKPNDQCNRHADHHPSGIEARGDSGQGSKPPDRVGHRKDSRTDPNRTLVMVVMMMVAVTAMIVMMAVPMSIVMIMMMNTLMRTAAAWVFAEQQRFDRHRHGE
jgi:hypothetical protein